MKLLILLCFVVFSNVSSNAQKKEIIRQEIGLIFLSSFSTYDSSGKFNHGIEYFNATDDYFIPLKKYKKTSNPIELFKSDNLKKGFILFSYAQRSKIIENATEYNNNLDSSSCYFTPTFKLIAVKIKYKILSHSEASFCNGNNSIIFSDSRLIRFSYNSWGRKIIDIKPL
jgi:hypothetical protein